MHTEMVSKQKKREKQRTKMIAIMLGFVKARKWVDFVDKNLSQQTKNWDRFIDPPFFQNRHIQ